MPVPTWSPGEILTSADVLTWMRPLVGYKVGDTSQTTNVILSNDGDMTVTFTTAGTWVIEVYCRYNGPTSNGLAFAFSGTGLTGNFSTLFIPQGGGGVDLRQHPWSYTGMVANTTGVLNTLGFRVSGLVTAKPGAFTFQWAQFTSSGTTTVRQGSYLMAWRAN